MASDPTPSSPVDVREALLQIAHLYRSGAGNTARSMERELLGLTTEEIERLAAKVNPKSGAAREHWVRGFRSARGDVLAAALMIGSRAEEGGARDSKVYDIGFQAGLGCGWAVSQRNFGRVCSAAFVAGKAARIKELAA